MTLSALRTLSPLPRFQSDCKTKTEENLSDMKPSLEENPNPNHNLFSEAKLCQDFCAHLKLSGGFRDGVVKEEKSGAVENRGDDAGEEEEEEFSFVCGGANASPIAAEDAFFNGQIKPVFPLFNRDLLFSGQDADALHDNLPMSPPVKKVFVETNEGNHQVTSSAPENDGATGAYCEWSNRKAVEASPEVCKKSNSTGFSKIWRFKDFMGRSNSDGRDAFVFLNNGHAPPAAAADRIASSVAAKGQGRSGRKESTVKANGVKVKKGKTASLSAHEVYLRSKAKGEERRRSYLPYRPELMGFFTNVNGGLTKNVHPF